MSTPKRAKSTRAVRHASSRAHGRHKRTVTRVGKTTSNATHLKIKKL